MQRLFQALLVCTIAVALSVGAHAEDETWSPLAPLPEQNPQAKPTNNKNVYTTKRLPFTAPTPPINPAPADNPPTQPNANNAGEGGVKFATPNPFGKSTATLDRQAPVGPSATRAVPVDNIDMIETGEPVAAEPAENEANPVTEDPAQPTQLTAPIFTAQSNAVQRITVIRVLNKVTARAEKLEIKEDQSVTSGKLRIAASHCQHSDPSSLPDDAALVTVAEIVGKDKADKPLFSGWMYQSSASINALEHPIYDVSLVACKDPVVEKPPEKPAASKKKSSKTP